MNREQLQSIQPLPGPDNIQKFADSVRRTPAWENIDGWKGTLDKISIWWQEAGDRLVLSERMRKATQALNVPHLERYRAAQVLKERDGAINPIVSSIAAAVEDPKVTWTHIKAIYDQVHEYQEDTPHHAQIIALLEAMDESMGGRLNPRRARQLIAQSAWDEVWRIGAYRIIEYSNRRRTVQDRSTINTLEIEKNQIIGALHSKPWSSGKRKEQEKVYLQQRETIGRNFDREVNDALANLWRAVCDNEGQRVSAIDILDNAEDLYQTLQSEGYFDQKLSAFHKLEEAALKKDHNK